MINIVNKHTYVGGTGATVVYVGRPGVLGNPYDMLKYGRDTCVNLYQNWLREKVKSETPQLNELIRIAALAEAGDVDLMCFCEPLNCHARIIKNAVTWVMSLPKEPT